MSLQDRWRSSPPRAERWKRRDAAILVSVLLHAAALAFLLGRARREMPPPEHPIEIEMVQQAAQVAGQPPPPTPPPPETPVSASAAAPADPALPPKPSDAQGILPQGGAPPSAPSPPAKQPTPARKPAPEVNLGNSDQDFDPLTVTGDDVVQPTPDMRYRNLPPHYPASAARAGAQGTVRLVVRVLPSGLVMGVGLLGSSGNAALDEEARRAVMLWHFRPAQSNGRAVPYDYFYEFHFNLD